MIQRLILIFCSVIYEVQSNSKSWTVKMPNLITALKDSCVVIPCEFNYPDPKNLIKVTYEGIWYASSDVVVYNNDSLKVKKSFRNRTNLVGLLNLKNCSLKIDNVTKSDEGHFSFRIVMPEYKKYSYKETAKLVVKDAPQSPILAVNEMVKSGEVMSVNCSVFHTCLYDPPVIEWSRNEMPNVKMESLSEGIWRWTSMLTFTPKRIDHNKSLFCSAKYKLVDKVTSSKTLNIAYAPVNVLVETESAVVEGDAVQLRCSSDSNPAAHRYQWYSVTGALLSEGHSYTLQNISRDIEALYCAAINTEGQSNSTLVQINGKYPPEINVNSSCTTNLTVVICHCHVKSNPQSDIKWILLGGIQPSRSTQRNGSMTVGLLHVALGLTDMVYCFASNNLGNATFGIPTSHGGVLKLIYISVSVASAIVLGLVSLGLWKFTRAKKQVQGHEGSKSSWRQRHGGRVYCNHALNAKENLFYTGGFQIRGKPNTYPYEEDGGNAGSRCHDLEDEALYGNCFQEDIYANM